MKKTSTGLRKTDVKIALIGKQNVGKSALLARYKFGFFQNASESTIGAALVITERISSDGSGIIKASIWDTAGMERFQSLIPMYLRGAQCIFICFDRLDSAVSEISETIKFVRLQNEFCRIVLVQTKIDFASSFNIEENRSNTVKLEEYVAKNKYKLYKTSAKLNIGVKELFEENIDICYTLKKAEIASSERNEVVETSPLHSVSHSRMTVKATAATINATACCNIM